jgi:hypothetical protein
MRDWKRWARDHLPLADALRDVRFGVRALARKPLVTALVVRAE